MSPLSYKASRNAESLRHSVKEYKKETKILKLNAGFIYADNPNRGENIFKALGFFYLSVKKFMVKFFTKFCHNVIKQSCVGQQIFFPCYFDC